VSINTGKIFKYFFPKSDHSERIKKTEDCFSQNILGYKKKLYVVEKLNF